ncbi:MAG: hypothetical protein V4857_25335 [Pseudomonadota bacterium]
MRAIINSFQLILSAARHRQAESLGVKIALLLLMVLGTGLTLKFGPWRMAVSFGIGIPASCLLLIMWSRLVLGLVLQNSPARALLVPRLRLRLVGVFLALCALASIGLALIFSVTMGHVHALALGIATVLLIISLTLRYPALSFVFFVFALFSSQIANIPLRAIGGDPLALAILTPLVLALAWKTAQLLLQNGGDVHAAFQARLLKHPLLAANAAQANPQVRLGLIETALLRRDCARRAPASAMLGYVLGPSYQWIQMPVFALACVGVVGFAQRYVLAPGTVSENFSFIVTWSSIAATMLAPLALLYLVDANLRTKHNEQILLRLAPAIPQGAGLNQSFAHALMRRLLVSWTVALLCALSLLLIRDANLAGLMVVLSSAVLMLPLAALPLKNYASAAVAAPSSSLALAILAVLVLLGVMAVLTLKFKAPWLLLLGLYGGAALFLIGLRWRAMVASPPAFPLGHMA